MAGDSKRDFGPAHLCHYLPLSSLLLSSQASPDKVQSANAGPPPVEPWELGTGRSLPEGRMEAKMSSRSTKPIAASGLVLMRRRAMHWAGWANRDLLGILQGIQPQSPLRLQVPTCCAGPPREDTGLLRTSRVVTSREPGAHLPGWGYA